jgi:hypothetical protein
MKKTKVLESLTYSQRQEFENDIKSAIDKIIETKNIYASKLHEVNINLRLENKIFLNVTIEFTVDNNDKISGHIKDIVKFDDVDQYLDSIIAARQSSDGGKTIL